MITVHIATNKQTELYTKQCMTYALGLAHDQSNIQFKLHDTVHNGSIGHSECMMRVFSSFEPGININCDSDSALVFKGWDTTILRELEHVDCLATQFDDWDRPPHNGDVVQSYKKKPHFIWAAFREGKPWHKLDFTGTNTSVHVEIKTQEQSELYGLAIGRKVGHDNGWNTTVFWGQENASFKLFNHSRKRTVLSSCPTHNEEYELDGVPFVCHQRSCRKTPFKQGMSKLFYEAVERYNQFT